MPFEPRPKNAARSGTRLLLLAALCGATPVFGQTAPEPSESAMVNLVRQLVKQGVLKKEAGDALMAQAEAEAAAARARAAAAPAQQASADLPPPASGSIRVPYVPQTVRDQIRDEIKTEVLAQAKTEGWASPDAAAPDWTRRIKLYGDIRFRSQSNLYSRTNATDILDFRAVNDQGPFVLLQGQAAPGGVTPPPVSLPYLDTTQDRVGRLRLRARLGVVADIAPGVTAGMAFATGDDPSGVSTDTSLAGGLGKRDIWIDQAYISWQPKPWFKANFGRFVNPFLATDLIYDYELRFDGLSAEVDVAQFIDDRFNLFVRGGAFPLNYGSPDYPSGSQNKQKVAAQYIFSGQVEARANVTEDVKVAAAAAYHRFQNVQGQLSTPCDPINVTGVVECDTDYQRPSFLRKGNTLFPLRDINVLNNTNPPQPQFLGLVFAYEVLDFTGNVTFPIREDTNITLTGNYIKNIAFKKSDACRFNGRAIPINNVANNGNPCLATNPDGFQGGDVGYLGQVMIAHGPTNKKGSWEFTAGYRYLETDATLDALTDNEFHLGGTNAKGYFVGGNYSVYDGLSVGARWLSANEITGRPLAIDVLQLDLMASF